MDYSRLSLPEIFIMGVAIRTTNAGGKASEDIPAFWQYVQEDNLLDAVSMAIEPHKVFAIYTDYAPDGSYVMIIGKQVASLENVPASLVTCTIPAGNYAAFSAHGAEFGQSVGHVWEKIWQMPLDRAFTCDFEIYEAELLSKPIPEVPIYVALK